MPRKALKSKKGSHLLESLGVIYARYSSHNQKEISIDQQVGECRQLAQECGISIVDVYKDKAITGKTDKRPDFQRMLKDAKLGKFQYVLAWKSSRIGRNMVEALTNETYLKDLGIQILYVEEDFDDTAAGRFAARSMMNVNQFYIENMGEDIKRSMNDNASNCMVTNGHLPLGYKADKELHYILDEPAAKIVQEIFERVAEGDSFADIGADLNSRGIKTSSGREWGRSSFHSLIRNERYRGIYIYDEIRIEGGIPRIISDELFFRVQEVLKVKKKVKGRHQINGNYMLTGKLYCGKCGAHMTGESGTGKSGARHYYYACHKQREKGACDKKAIKRDIIEAEVARSIKDYILKDDVIQWIADAVEQYQKESRDNPEYALLQSQLADIKLSIKNMLKAIEKGIITDSTKARLEELEADQASVIGRISMLEANRFNVTRADVISWLESFRSGDVEDKEYQQKLFDSFLVAVYVYDDKIKIVFDIGGGERKEVDKSFIDGASESSCGCSYKLPFAPPQESQTNTTDGLVMIAGMFVLSIPLALK